MVKGKKAEKKAPCIFGILSKAADVIEKRGWCRNFENERGAVCALGGISHAVGFHSGVEGECRVSEGKSLGEYRGSDDRALAYIAAQDFLLGYINKKVKRRYDDLFCSVPEWNDMGSSSKKKVVATIREAATAAAEEMKGA